MAENIETTAKKAETAAGETAATDAPATYTLQFEGDDIESLLEKLNKSIIGKAQAVYRTQGIYQTTVTGLTKLSMMTDPVCFVFLTGATASGNLKPYLESCAYKIDGTQITFSGYTEDSVQKERYFNFIIFDSDRGV